MRGRDFHTVWAHARMTALGASGPAPEWDALDDCDKTAWMALSAVYQSSSTRPAACGCREFCGDDGDIDGPGVCKGLPSYGRPITI